MKKLITLLLAVVMCFSLAACGGDKETSNNGKSEKFNLCQEWKNVLTGLSIAFDKDGVVVLEDGTEYKYEYDKKLELVSLYLSQTVNLNVTEENGVYKIGTNKTWFVTTANYDDYHAVALEEAYADATEGEAVVKIGESFVGMNGLKITVNSAEFVDAKEGDINLSITCENTSSKEIVFVDHSRYIRMRGSAFATMRSSSRCEFAADDKTIPANSTKELVITAKLDTDLTENSNTYILIGIPYEETDSTYKYNYVDVAAFYAE